MASIAEIMQLCRLCLVKEQVNVPIFEEQGDIRQIFLKITACLPVKISREDNLPKKICNGCLYKLELLYQFWNTSTNAEKQLLSWLTAAGLDATTQTTQDAMAVVTQTQVVLKQEPNPEITENVTVVSDPGNFILQAAQQPIEFPAVDFDYQDNFTAEQELANNAISADVDDSTESEPVAKRPRRTATATVTAPLIESEDDADDPGEAAVAAKTEEDSDDDTNVEPTFVDVAEDQDGEQPGPSGLGKIVEPSIFFIQEMTFACEMCEQMFTTIEKLDSHRDEHFRQSAPETDLSKYKCKHCEVSYLISAKQLEEHIYRRHTGIRHKCEKCEKDFSSVEYLKKHEKTHDPDFKKKVHSCPHCKRTFVSKNNFRMHMQTHDGTRPLHVCHICGKGLISKDGYDQHLAVHRNEKSYVCEICGKGFNVKKLLVIHSRVHTKIKPYKCEICQNRFTQRSSLTVHLRSHRGIRPHVCDICERAFVTKTQLKYHVRSHEKVEVT